MKTKIFGLLIVLFATMQGLFAQKPTEKPLDPVIAKFNDGVAKVNAGDFKTAIADFEQVLTLPETEESKKNDLKNKAKTQLPILHYQVANALINQKKYEDAIPSLKKTVELADLYANNAPTKEKALKFLPQLLTGIGGQKLKEKNYPAAIESFNEALKYDASYTKAYLGKGKVYADQFKEKDMIESLNKAIEIGKQASDTKTVEKAQAMLGDYYTNQGNISMSEVDPENEDFTAAIASFEKAVSLNPAAADASYMLSVIWNKSNEFDKAIESGKKALVSETDANKIAAINYELGVAYFGNADYPAACEAYKKALVGPVAEKARVKKDKVPGCQ